MRNLEYVLLCFCSLIIFCCASDEQPMEMENTIEPAPKVFGAFEINADEEVVLSGTIDANTANDLVDLLDAYPDTDRILMSDVNGATSADAAFNAARIVRANNLDIHIKRNSTIRKEAVDFLLGGIKRTKGDGVMIGQSAWINDLGQEATDFGFGDDAHLPWINFYVEMEYQYQLATDYYNFYIYASDANDIYFFTEDQIDTFDLIN